MRINLSNPELYTCRMLGVMRRSTAKDRVVDQSVGKENPWAMDMDGVIGEFCVAKILNLWPDMTIGVRKGGADIVTQKGTTIDVKTTRVKSGKLLATLSKASDPCDAYVLAIVDDNGCTIAGWASKEMLFKKENINDLGHGNGYCLTQDQLNKDIHEIY